MHFTLPSFAVILPAAGASARFGSNKLLELLHGKPVLLHTLRAFTRRDDVSHIVVVTHDFATVSESLQTASSSVLIDPRLNFCRGGACRAASVRAGLESLPESVEWVAIHDAARPLVSQELIAATLAAAAAHGAAAPALPVHLTIKRATGPLPAPITETIPRHQLWAMQTPQIARRKELLEAIADCPIPIEQVTDDVQFLELVQKPVWLVEGEERNLKITTKSDLLIAEIMD